MRTYRSRYRLCWSCASDKTTCKAVTVRYPAIIWAGRVCVPARSEVRQICARCRAQGIGRYYG